MSYARHADYCFLSYRGIMELLNMGVRLDGVRLRVFDLGREPFHKYRQVQPIHILPVHLTTV